MTTYSGPGILLRAVEDSDLPIFFEHQKDRAAQQMAAFTVENPDDEEAFKAFWDKIRSDSAITIRTLEVEGVVAGHLASFKRFGNPEVSYWLGSEFWGREIGTRSLARFLQEVRTRPMYARAARDNIASIRVLEKNGFRISHYERAHAAARGEEIEEAVLRLD